MILHDYTHNDDLTPGHWYFGTLAVDDTRTEPTGSLVFGVEGMSGEAPVPQFCTGDGECHEVGIGVLAESGRLHVLVDRPREGWKNHKAALGMADWPAQDVEVSVTDPGSRLKVFHEVQVVGPSGAPDCSGYPAMDVDRFTCLFLREELPAETPGTTAALRAGLPNLVQPVETTNWCLPKSSTGGRST